MDPLSNFHHAAALHLAKVSPALAALNAHRAQRETKRTISPLHCSRCGHIAVTTRLSSAPRTRHACQKRKTKQFIVTQNESTCRYLVRSCAACGNIESHKLVNNSQSPRTRVSQTIDLPKAASVDDLRTRSLPSVKDPKIEPSDPPFSGAKRGKTQTTQISNVPMTSGNKQVDSSLQPKSALPAEKTGSKRVKKKSALQEMLARSKEQNVNRLKENNQEGGGLSAFLSGL